MIRMSFSTTPLTSLVRPYEYETSRQYFTWGIDRLVRCMRMMQHVLCSLMPCMANIRTIIMIGISMLLSMSDPEPWKLCSAVLEPASKIVCLCKASRFSTLSKLRGWQDTNDRFCCGKSSCIHPKLLNLGTKSGKLGTYYVNLACLMKL